MRIRRGCVVGVDYVLRLDDGRVLDESSPDAPLTFVYGEGEVLPGLERALEGLAPGDRREVVIPPDEGFGERDPRGVEEVPRSAFPRDEQLRAGEELLVEDEDGEPIPFEVLEADDRRVRVDLNHPLAGRTLRLDVTVREVRPPESIAGSDAWT